MCPPDTPCVLLQGRECEWLARQFFYDASCDLSLSLLFLLLGWHPTLSLSLSLSLSRWVRYFDTVCVQVSLGAGIPWDAGIPW